MAVAAFKITKTTGTAPGTEADTAKSENYVSTDATGAVKANFPIAVPALVSDPANYSFENWLRLELTTAPDNQITNIKVWGSSNQPNGDAKLTQLIGTTATYTTATDSASSVATTVVHTSANSVGTAVAVSGTLTAVGNKSNFFVLQLKVEFGAGKGTLTDETFNIQYDES